MGSLFFFCIFYKLWDHKSWSKPFDILRRPDTTMDPNSSHWIIINCEILAEKTRYFYLFFKKLWAPNAWSKSVILFVRLNMVMAPNLKAWFLMLLKIFMKKLSAIALRRSISINFFVLPNTLFLKHLFQMGQFETYLFHADLFYIDKICQTNRALGNM